MLRRVDGKPFKFIKNARKLRKPAANLWRFNDIRILNLFLGGNKMENLQQHFGKVKEVLASSLSGYDFQTWIEPLFLDGKSTVERIVLVAPNRLVRDFVERNHLTVIANTWSGLDSDQPVKVAVEVDKNFEQQGSLPLSFAPRPKEPEVPVKPAPAKPVKVKGVDPKKTMESFIVTDASRECFGAAERLLNGGPEVERWNPFLLLGKSGFGKTHLANAIALMWLESHPGGQVKFAAAEKFLNDFTGALMSGKMADFRKEYRELPAGSLVVIDDLQDLLAGNKTKTWEELYHLLEEWKNAEVQMIFTSRQKPADFQALDEALCSRLTGGLVFEFKPPDKDLSRALATAIASEAGATLPENVADFLAMAFPGNLRNLEGAVIKLLCKCSLNRIPMERLNEPSMDLCSRLLDWNSRQTQPTLEKIISQAEKCFGFSHEKLACKLMPRKLTEVRRVLWFVARHLLDLSYPEIGGAFSKDHTTVLSAVKGAEEMWRNKDQRFVMMVGRIMEVFPGHFLPQDI